MQTTKKMTASAVLIALATALSVLSGILPFRFLQGGSITLGSMVPIILISLMFGTKWGVLSGVVYGFLQMLLDFHPAPTPTFLNMLLVVVLDYMAAFSVLGFAHLFFALAGKRKASIAFSGLCVTVLRYLCHIVSGVFIWGVYRQAGQPVLLYSVLYNGSYMLPEICITTAVLAALTPTLKKYKLL